MHPRSFGRIEFNRRDLIGKDSEACDDKTRTLRLFAFGMAVVITALRFGVFNLIKHYAQQVFLSKF
jgi:hypothetical protein